MNLKSAKIVRMGKSNAFLKHLRMKPVCASMYEMQSVYAERDQLKKSRKEQYDKMHYAKKLDKKRQYYQENKEQRLKYKKDYYEKNKEQRLEYNKEYYKENKEQRLEYQRKYDKTHKQQKKEYKKLKAHYRKYANNMHRIFQMHDISHFKSHNSGWCDWSKRDQNHDHCWENVTQQCNICHVAMFKLKCSVKWEKPYEINALHCISCTQVVCHLCGKCIQEYEYYLHFYINGVNSDLKDKAKLCPYRTYLDICKKQEKNFPCEICSDDEIQEKRKDFVKTVGIKYMNFLNEKTWEVTSRNSNPGKETLLCPCNQQDIQSTVCPHDAVTKLAKRINNGFSSDRKVRLCFDYTQCSRHRTKFDLMCDLKKHIELHEERRVETHVVELTLADAFSNLNDLDVIDTLLKLHMEKFEQV